jgi:hypothetical protein
MFRRPRVSLAFVVAMAAFVVAVAVAQQRRDAFVLSRDHPAIRYSTGDLDNPIVRLNERLTKGEVRLTYDAAHGYLTSLLDALAIPVSSQMLVFSKTSFQADLVTMHNPRAIYFGDDVFVGWVRGADVLEIAAADRRQGSVFYTLQQKAPGAPGAPVTLERKTDCLACHLSWDTRGVPGLMTTSMYPLPDDPNAYANGFTTVQGSPLTQRWGGWWVTGDTGGAQHLGNIPVMPAEKNFAHPRNPKAPLQTVEGFFDLKGYPAGDERRRGAARARARDDRHQSDRAARLGGARRRGGAVGRRVGTREGRGRRARRVHAVPRRGAARPPRAGVVRLCRSLRCVRAARCEGAVAAGPRPPHPPVQVSVQLPDLRRGVQRAAPRGQAGGLWAHVGSALRPRHA